MHKVTRGRKGATARDVSDTARRQREERRRRQDLAQNDVARPGPSTGRKRGASSEDSLRRGRDMRHFVLGSSSSEGGNGEVTDDL